MTFRGALTAFVVVTNLVCVALDVYVLTQRAAPWWLRGGVLLAAMLSLATVVLRLAELRRAAIAARVTDVFD